MRGLLEKQKYAVKRKVLPFMVLTAHLCILQLAEFHAVVGLCCGHSGRHPVAEGGAVAVEAHATCARGDQRSAC